ncbi:hypothetical protein JAAARDRAFT_149003 [Jaapia argillacea MUCL 33604]|uniref:Phytochrome n=1 Tax=Jaapia argillacea MUCL 33604 TaxID=933084 RepID=A0A067Q7V7_9AGAM|nr:hypothetical protein JAAARDRAFT_149003 [Jaapia argillacea MUCL 33604]
MFSGGDSARRRQGSTSSTSPAPISPSSSPKTSFIYPIRSFLSGRIQPATQDGLQPTRPSLARTGRTASADSVPSKKNTMGKLATMLQGMRLGRSGSFDSAQPIAGSSQQWEASSPQTSESTKYDLPAASASMGPPATLTSPSIFRDADGNEDVDPFAPRPYALPSSDTPSTEKGPFYTAGPTGEPVRYYPEYLLDRSRSSPALVEVTEASTVPQSLDSDILQHAPFNLSQKGIVHLGPILTDHSSDTDSLNAGTSFIPGFLPFSGAEKSSRSSMPANSDSGPARARSDAPHTTESPPPRGSGLESTASTTAISPSGTSSGSTRSPVTFRFQHQENEDGHHVVAGLEGPLIRCEDEPIRTPGSVQGFGVLMVLEQHHDTGYLIVRQVSENSSEILGLTPKYLFSLNCLTETLPDGQVDVLWDNIQYLKVPEPDADDPGQDEAPHIFLLSGLGEPGTSTPDHPGDSSGRRFWTCWCAAHRPSGPSASTDSPTNRILVILEFELESDTINPLYPSVGEASSSSPTGGDSPMSTRSTGPSAGIAVSQQAPADARVAPPSTDGTSTSSVTIAVPGSTPTRNTHPERLGSDPSGSSPALEESDDWLQSRERILESTTNHAKPIYALERLRRLARNQNPPLSQPPLARGARLRTGGLRGGQGTAAVGMMDVFAVMAEMNEQLGAAPDIDSFLQIVVGVIKDLTQFHRVLVYKFDEDWNGQTLAELVDWNQTHELYKGLHFPASDIPVQARQLYAINKVRLLYDRSQTTARLVARSKEDLDPPLNMAHCYLRAMSPIHLKYLENMGVRASMSISIMGFGSLWGLVACHSYGSRGMRVSFPVRQMLRLLSQSISRNVERLTFSERLKARKLFQTMPSEQHPSGYIVSNADDLLGLFDADFGMLVIGEGAKILGPNQHSQEILIIAEYLRLKQFSKMEVSHMVTKDYPDLHLTMGLDVIAGLLYVPLSTGGRDFIAFLRKGQLQTVRWAGKPFKVGSEGKQSLEPRNSFRVWSEVVAGKCRPWTDEQLETASVLALVYGKFIEVWRQKESALQTTKLTEILLSNASHEVRTPLNHIINYLELALNGPLDNDTRDNLVRSHAASKSLLFTINDLLDLTRLETGNETSFNEPFDLRSTIEEAVHLYRDEAARRNLRFNVVFELSPKQMIVIGDARKVKTAVANLTANAVKFTSEGAITIQCRAFEEPDSLRDPKSIAVEIFVADTGCGIPGTKLESIFRDFEQVSTTTQQKDHETLGLGLAVVARIVEQLGGQLRVDSKLGEGSRFSFVVPFQVHVEDSDGSNSPSVASLPLRSRRGSRASTGGSEVQSFVEVLATNHMSVPPSPPLSRTSPPIALSPPRSSQSRRRSKSRDLEPSEPKVYDSSMVELQAGPQKTSQSQIQKVAFQHVPLSSAQLLPPSLSGRSRGTSESSSRLRVLVVEASFLDDDINRMILCKRLTLDGHDVTSTRNGQECVGSIERGDKFDCILMDLQMPILNGWEATRRIRELEKLTPYPTPFSDEYPLLPPSLQLNGRIPVFAVSASLIEHQRHEMMGAGFDGWIPKPVDFKRLRLILKGVTDTAQHSSDAYRPGRWETGGWLVDRPRGRSP